jgi:hypothetical protein
LADPAQDFLGPAAASDQVDQLPERNAPFLAQRTDGFRPHPLTDRLIAVRYRLGQVGGPHQDVERPAGDGAALARALQDLGEGRVVLDGALDQVVAHADQEPLQALFDFQAILRIVQVRYALDRNLAAVGTQGRVIAAVVRQLGQGDIGMLAHRASSARCSAGCAGACRSHSSNALCRVRRATSCSGNSAGSIASHLPLAMSMPMTSSIVSLSNVF